MRMKVAFVAFDFGEYCTRLAGGIAEEQDTKVLLLLPRDEGEPYRHLLSPGIDCRLFEKPRIRQLFRQLKMVFTLVRQIRAFKPDVLHLQLGHMWFNLLGLPFLRDIPLVLTVHDSLIHVGDAATARTPQWVYDRGCFQARERIVHAPQVKELLVKRTGVPPESVHVMPFVIVGDVDVSAGQEFVEEPLILFFGRIWEYKGLEYLIKAEPLITSRVPQAKIVIAGTGEDFDRYRRMMVNPENFIVHNEFVSDHKRAELFQRASVVVLPYIEASQSFIISIAYRFGKPVVATTVGGLPEMVDDGRTGYLISPRKPQEIADAVVRLMQDGELRHRMGAAGMRKVNVECAPAAVGKSTVRVYRIATSPTRSARQKLLVEGSISKAAD
jgi:glycosyltransferase involved in cell wall biosynthesis